MKRMDTRAVESSRAIYKSGLHILPTHMRDGVSAYIETGRPTGGFLTALLHGDHEHAKANADHSNKACWQSWIIFLLEYMPREAFGTPTKVAAWRKHKGLVGIEDGEPDF